VLITTQFIDNSHPRDRFTA